MSEALARSGNSDTTNELISLIDRARKGDRQARLDALFGLQLMRELARPAVPDLGELLRDNDEEIREAAASALAAIGPAGDSVPKLIEMLKDEAAGDEAAEALARAGRLAVPSLIQALDAPQATARANAIAALRGIGPEAKDALPALIARFKKEDAEGRADIARAWGAFRAAAGPAAPLLVQSLADSDNELRLEAARALWEIKERPEPVVPTLISLIQAKPDTNGQPATTRSGFALRDQAADLLGKIGPEARDAVPILLQGVEDCDSLFAAACIEALGEMGDEAKQAIPAIAARLGDERKASIMPQPHGIEDMGDVAWIALGRMGPDVATALQPKLKSDDAKVRVHAAAALGQLGPDGKAAVDVLLAAMGDPDENVRRRAVEALGRIGPAVSGRLPAVVRGLEDPSWLVRGQAVSAAVNINPQSPHTLAALKRALGDGELRVQGMALESLIHVGPAAKDLGPDVASRLNSDEEYRRGVGFGLAPLASSAADALGAMGPAAARTAPALLQVLRTHRDWRTRLAAVRALSSFGPAAKAVAAELPAACREMPEATLALAKIDPQHEGLVSLLVEAAQPNREAPEALLRAIAVLGPRAKAAAPALTHRVDDGDDRERTLAARALLHIDREDVRALDVLIKGLHTPDGQRAMDGLPDGEFQLTLRCLGPRAEQLAAAVAEHIDDARDIGIAVRLLGRMGPAAATAAPKLLACLDDSWDLSRQASVASLVRIGPAVVPHAIRALGHERTWVRVGAAEVLGRLGPQAAPTIDSLVQSLADHRMPVRAAAAESLGRIGPPAARAIPALEAARLDSYRHVRQQAERALRTLAPRSRTSSDSRLPF